MARKVKQQVTNSILRAQSLQLDSVVVLQLLLVQKTTNAPSR